MGKHERFYQLANKQEKKGVKGGWRQAPALLACKVYCVMPTLSPSRAHLKGRMPHWQPQTTQAQHWLSVAPQPRQHTKSTFSECHERQLPAQQQSSLHDWFEDLPSSKLRHMHLSHPHGLGKDREFVDHRGG